MTTSVELSDPEIAKKELTNQADAAAAVRIALSEYLRYVRRMLLKELSGRVEMQENWPELEQVELEGDKHGAGPGVN
jgi:hypothetical protein